MNFCQMCEVKHTVEGIFCKPKIILIGFKIISLLISKF